MLPGRVLTLVACGCLAVAADGAAGERVASGGVVPESEPALAGTTQSVASAAARTEAAPAPVARPGTPAADRVEALARALLLLSAAGGHRPFPTIPQ